MPTYEYECPKCGHCFEEFQSMSDPPIKTCPKCRGRKVKRLVGTGAGIIFKGSGFYQTDYRSDSYRQGAKKDTGSDAKDSSAKKEKKEKKADVSKASKPDKKS